MKIFNIVIPAIASFGGFGSSPPADLLALLGIDVDDFADYVEDNNLPILTAAFDSCNRQSLQNKGKSFGANLDCGKFETDEKVSHKSSCTWSCGGNKFLKFGKDKNNEVSCLDGKWQGLKRPVCVERCSWESLGSISRSSEFAHCRNHENFGESKFNCKVQSANLERGIKKSSRARCSCSSARESGKCEWVRRGL